MLGDTKPVVSSLLPASLSSPFTPLCALVEFCRMVVGVLGIVSFLVDISFLTCDFPVLILDVLRVFAPSSVLL